MSIIYARDIVLANTFGLSLTIIGLVESKACNRNSLVV